MVAVVARDELTAFEALDLNPVEYEPHHGIQPPRGKPDDRRTQDSRIRQPWNVHKAVSLGFGDVDAGLAAADRVFEDTFFYQGSTHLPSSSMPRFAAIDRTASRAVVRDANAQLRAPRAGESAPPCGGAHPCHRTPTGGALRRQSDPFNHEMVVAKAALCSIVR